MHQGLLTGLILDDIESIVNDLLSNTFLPSSITPLMSLVTRTLLYIGSGKISLLGTLPLLGTLLPSFIKKWNHRYSNVCTSVAPEVYPHYR